MRRILILFSLLTSISLKAQTKNDFLLLTSASFSQEKIEIRSQLSSFEREINVQRFNLGLAYSFKDNWFMGLQVFLNNGNKKYRSRLGEIQEIDINLYGAGILAKKFFLIKNNLFFVANAELNYKAGEGEIQLIDTNGVYLPLSSDLQIVELIVMPSLIYKLNDKFLAELGFGLISISHNKSKAESVFDSNIKFTESETQINLNPLFLKIGLGVKL